MKRMSLDLLHEEIADCHKCLLRDDDNVPILSSEYNEDAKIFLITHAPKSDEKLCDSFYESRNGRYLLKLMKEAGLCESDIYVASLVRCFSTDRNLDISERSVELCRNWVWKELTTVKPKVIITIGLRPTTLLLKLTKKINFATYAGDLLSVPYTDAKIAPWYDFQYLLGQGAKIDKKTIDFLKKVKKYSNE